MRIDPSRQLVFPICDHRQHSQTTLCPVVCSLSQGHKVRPAANEFKRLKYSDLAAGWREAGWEATGQAVEIRCRGWASCCGRLEWRERKRLWLQWRESALGNTPQLDQQQRVAWRHPFVPTNKEIQSFLRQLVLMMFSFRSLETVNPSENIISLVNNIFRYLRVTIASGFMCTRKATNRLVTWRMHCDTSDRALLLIS